VKSRIKKGKTEGLEGRRGKKLFGICFVFLSENGVFTNIHPGCLLLDGGECWMVWW
jgi:hypothetical protein